MTHLYDDPTTFMEDMLVGFLDANQRYVVGVPGGVVRATQTPQGKVAVVVGGGSGHYPAFCGVVGPGFADGAVVGNIFTSPSTDDAYNVGKAAQNGGGLLFSTGNYAGDVMNFNLAADRLNAEGIQTRNVYVTDDVASAPVDAIASGAASQVTLSFSRWLGRPPTRACRWTRSSVWRSRPTTGPARWAWAWRAAPCRVPQSCCCSTCRQARWAWSGHPW